MQSRYANEQFTGTTIIMIKMRIKIVIQDENPSCTSVSLQQTYDPRFNFLISRYKVFGHSMVTLLWFFGGEGVAPLWVSTLMVE